MTAPLLTSDKVLTEFAAEVGESGPIAIEGGRTRWTRGGPLADGTRVLKAPSGVVDFQPDEMIVIVRAGTTVSELDEALAAQGQRSALPNRGGTVGGALAVGENDVAVLGKGMMRTSLLEVRYVSGEGKLIRGGGPTVKNVTGFDIPRIMVGSLGTLGCIAEVILRTNPIPAVSQWYEASGVDPFDIRDVILRPGAILWNGSTTYVLLEGHAVDVADQLRDLNHLGRFLESEGAPELPQHRWSLAPSDLRTLSRFDMGLFVASIGVGVVYAEKPQPQRDVSDAVRQVSERLKTNFDPTGRLNPGRCAWRV
jgi:glycolate oxidase FAD binding subunit